jgi:uncharacterized membrane protein
VRARAAATIAALALLALPSSVLARSLTVTDAEVNLQLGRDAALLAEERLRIDYEGHWQATYRDIVLKKGEKITNVGVFRDGRPLQPGACTVEGCVDQEDRYGATRTSSEEGEVVRVVWHVNATDEERTYELRYRVVDAVVAYDDVLDLEWQVWGDQWDFDLARLVATFTDPSLQPGEATPEKRSAVWGKPREVEGRDFLEAGEARLEADDVRSGQFVTMRVLLPREPGEDVSAARSESGEGLERILSEEGAIDDDFNSPFNRAKRWIADNAILLSILLSAATLLGLVLMRWMAREHPVDVPEHLPEPPDDASPALAFALAREGEDSNDTVLATLLDLIERGYYDSDETTTEDEKLDLAISKASKRPSSKLAPHEKEVLDFFDALIESDTVAMSEMKDRIPEHSATWRARWESMTSSLNDVEEGQLEWDRDMNGKSLLLGLAAAVGFALIALAYNDVESEWIAPVAIGVVSLLAIVLWPSTSLKRLSPSYRERSARWSAFERWTRDFPRLKDDPPATLDLWKKVLIFGVAFGTAERMIKSGRIPEPVLESSQGTWTGYYMAGGYTDASFSGSAFSSGFSSQVAPESSSGGGGGFSGGGGGASGGGGGGGW